MAFAPSRSKKHDTKKEGELNMNSMMDMMTIILLFLLKSFSTDGALVAPSQDLTLPTSFQTEKPKKELNVAISQDAIIVNDIPILSLSSLHPEEMMIPALNSKLAEYAQKEKQLELDVGKEFTHQVIIQGDRTIPFEVLIKVMYTCSQSEFYKMRLLTVKKGG
ncbi:MAG: biopolymer transporter ExbD [Calditrichia bacterium]|nr:biopolymer transporter ExbD [Calditrichia bacterium]